MTKEQIYLLPKTIEEALEFAKSSTSDFKYLAGGTDIMPNRFQGNEKSPSLIDISNLKELKGVQKYGDFLRIGALETLDNLAKYDAIKSEFPALIEAANAVGSPLIRKTATIGGNVLCENRCLYYNQAEWWREAVGLCLKCEGDICIASGGKNRCFSELVSDTAPALIAMDAELLLLEEKGERRAKLETIYTHDGVFPLNLEPTTIVVAILLPLDRGFKCSFKKLRQRKSLEFTSLTSAVAVDSAGKLKIALAGVNAGPVVVEDTIDADKANLIKLATKGAKSVDNDMYSRKYRRKMIGVFLNKSFEELIF